MGVPVSVRGRELFAGYFSLLELAAGTPNTSRLEWLVRQGLTFLYRLYWISGRAPKMAGKIKQRAGRAVLCFAHQENLLQLCSLTPTSAAATPTLAAALLICSLVQGQCVPAALRVPNFGCLSFNFSSLILLFIYLFCRM